MNQTKEIGKRIITDLKDYRRPLLVLFLYLIVTNLIFGTPCPQAIILGIACPGCGLTRAGLLLFTGHFADAWNLNPTIYVWVGFLLYCIIMRYILGRKIVYALPLAIPVGILTIFRYIWGLFHGYLVPVPCKGILGPLVQIFAFYFSQMMHK